MIHLLFLFVNSLLATNVYYVAQNGSDSGNGTQISPFATLNRAVYEIELLEGRGIINIEPGNYNQSLFSSAQNLVINIYAPEGQVTFEDLSINFNGNLLSLDNLNIYQSTITLSKTLFYIQNSSVENLRNDPYPRQTSSLVFRNTIFENGMVDISGDALLVEGCIFRDLHTIRFSRFEDSIKISGSSFIDNHGMVEVASSIVHITLSEFIGNVGLSTGAIETEINSRSWDVLFVEDTQFINNTALKEGIWHGIAPAVATTSNTTFIRCYFSCNKGNQSTSVPPVWESTYRTIKFVNCSSDPSCPVTCSLGSYSREHLVSCHICSAGSISNTTTAVGCLVCESGYSTVGRPGMDKCLPCAAGTVAGRNGSPMCTPCMPGSFAPDLGSTTCTPCPPGTYQPSSSSSSCLTCASGSVSSGSTRDCKICGEQTYASPTGENCLPCDIWLTSSPGALSCTKPSWAMGAMVGGLLFLLLLVFGVMVLKLQKHRPGYWEVQSIMNRKTRVLVDED